MIPSSPSLTSATKAPSPILIPNTPTKPNTAVGNPIKEPDNNKKKNKSINQVIHSRLRRFKQGKLRELFEASEAVISKTPKQQHENQVDVQLSAQLAADLDNFKSANAGITKHAPVALINDSNIQVFQNIHPPSLNRGCNKPRISTRNSGT